MNRAAVTLALILLVAVSMRLSFLGYAVYRSENMKNMDFTLFRNEYGNVPVSSPSLNFSPPVTMYRAIRIALESDGWNTTSLTNMTVFVSLDYRDFLENVTIIDGKYSNVMRMGSNMVKEVTQPAESYDPGVIQSATNGTVTYRYVWNIVVKPSVGLTCIPPPGLYWVDAATAEIVSKGFTFI